MGKSYDSPYWEWEDSAPKGRKAHSPKYHRGRKSLPVSHNPNEFFQLPGEYVYWLLLLLMNERERSQKKFKVEGVLPQWLRAEIAYLIMLGVWWTEHPWSPFYQHSAIKSQAYLEGRGGSCQLGPDSENAAPGNDRGFPMPHPGLNTIPVCSFQGFFPKWPSQATHTLYATECMMVAIRVFGDVRKGKETESCLKHLLLSKAEQLVHGQQSVGWQRPGGQEKGQFSGNSQFPKMK